MSRVIFHLTDAQAGALLKISKGERFAAFEGTRGKPSLLATMRERGFLDGWTLTELGRLLVPVCAHLVKASPYRRRERTTNNGRGR